MEQLSSFMGLLFLIGFCWLFSENKRKIQWKTVIVGVILQILFAIICLKTEVGRNFFQSVQGIFENMSKYSSHGASFIFGDLADVKKSGFVFAIHVFSTIIFCSALMAVLYYFGVMQKIIKYMSIVMMKLMKTSGSESLGATANIFLGQTESCLAIKPYVAGMTRSEMFALMVTGLSTVATSVVGAYIGMGLNPVHILTASFISAPAGLVCAKLLIPETEQSETDTHLNLDSSGEQPYSNPIDALLSGGKEGLTLCLEIASALIVFVALVPLFDSMLNSVGVYFHLNLSFAKILGVLFAPFAWVIGVSGNEMFTVGELLGKKLVLNEFVAYLDLLKVQKTLSPRSVIITTYALCGFANFSAVAVMISGIAGLAPKRKNEATKMGMKALLAGTIACLMTACVAGMIF